MECLGTIIRSGTRFTYYKDEGGDMALKMNQLKENRNGCKEQTEKEKNVMESIMNEFSRVYLRSPL